MFCSPEASVRVTAWQTLRAGLFLLFAVLLVVLGPVQDGAALAPSI